MIGPILRKNETLLRGDLLLTLYIMYELSKGEESFYFPYLSILPEPGSVSQWTDEQLRGLQNDALFLKAKNRLTMLRKTFNNTILKICQENPEVMPLELFTYENFLFAWYSVQARAFGKRLPWTAMVPFADCLNHSNLQTKYDYDVGNNGLFRLYPSGSNHYPRGSEVFNSYGRRHNENLLMDYGFAMLDNQWEVVDVTLSLERDEENYTTKRGLLFSLLGLHHYSVLSLQRGAFPLEALAFMRIVHATATEVEELEAFGSPIPKPGQWRQETSFLKIARNVGGEEEAEAVAQEHEQVTSRRAVFSAAHVLSLRNELRATRALLDLLIALTEEWQTTVAEDEAKLVQLSEEAAMAKAEGGLYEDGSTSDANWRTVCAVTYRLTRKRIVNATIDKLRVVILHLSLVERDGLAALSPSPGAAESLIDRIVATAPHQLDVKNYKATLVYVENLCAL